MCTCVCVRASVCVRVWVPSPSCLIERRNKRERGGRREDDDVASRCFLKSRALAHTCTHTPTHNVACTHTHQHTTLCVIQKPVAFLSPSRLHAAFGSAISLPSPILDCDFVRVCDTAVPLWFLRHTVFLQRSHVVQNKPVHPLVSRKAMIALPTLPKHLQSVRILLPLRST